jgi:hypothetical protein
VTSSTVYRPDGVEATKDLAVWTLAHRGYSGGGRLDVWVYPTKAAALLDGARLAMASGLEDDPRAVALFEKGRYQRAGSLGEDEPGHPPAGGAGSVARRLGIRAGQVSGAVVLRGGGGRRRRFVNVGCRWWLVRSRP